MATGEGASLRRTVDGATPYVMVPLGKMLLTFGLLMVVVGGAFLLANKLGFRGLPGDIKWRGRGFTIYAPIATSIVVSIVLSVILSVLRK